MTDSNDEYEVGYKKPPTRTRFQTGQSGNPKGRPRGAKNFDTALSKELRAHVEITEHGRRRKITKREAIAKQVVNKAAGGDAKFVPMLLMEVRRMEEKQENGSYVAMPMTPEDDLVAASIIARLKARLVEEAPDANS